MCKVWNGQVKPAVASGLEAVYRQPNADREDAATVRQVGSEGNVLACFVQYVAPPSLEFAQQKAQQSIRHHCSNDQ